jgi:hypothetical protein
LLGAVGRQFPKVDFELFDAVAQDHLWIRPEHKDRILKKYFPTDPSEPCRVHLSTAFDFLEDGSITIKEYVTTLVKTLEVRKTQNEVAGDSFDGLTREFTALLRFSPPAESSTTTTNCVQKIPNSEYRSSGGIA